MKVDNSTRLSVNQNRNSIRISTKDQFTVGSVWVSDILHVPFGVRPRGPPPHRALCARTDARGRLSPIVFSLGRVLVFRADMAPRGRGACRAPPALRRPPA